ncbi:MAG TPA: aldehyde dehydrogenase family protein [Solirubrobacterales bacterium]
MTEDPRPALIGGEWTSLVDSFEVRAPYDGRLLGKVGLAGAEEARRAIDAAAAALGAPLPAWRRAELLESIAAGIEGRVAEFARTICDEAGKPLKAARVEAGRAPSVFRLAAAEARTLAGEVVPPGATAKGEDHVAWTMRVPVGVVAAITPFNFPLNLCAHKLAPALAAGCPVVHKPAEKTPLSALLLAEVYEAADVPAGWLNVLCGDAPAIGDVFVEDERVRMISFTGSDRVGWGIRERAARKKVALELGNMSPLIVAADADLELAAEKTATHAFGFAGQTCVSVQRVMVERSCLEAFVAALEPRVDALVVGDPAAEATDVGPVIDAGAKDRVAAWVAEAVAAGAKVVAGGGETDDGLLRPTVLAEVPPQATLSRCEVFGPVCMISVFDDLEEAFARANATEFGLQAAVFTASIDKAMAAAEALDFGAVMINEAPEWRADEIPYGGVKASGNTKEGPHAAVREMTEERLVVIGLRR